jgi:hypothetical protein
MVDVEDVDDVDNNDKKRKGYYTDVAHFSNIKRAYRTRPGYGHPCKDFTAKEIIRFDGILMYNGVHGGDHALHHLWSDQQGRGPADSGANIEIYHWDGQTLCS